MKTSCAQRRQLHLRRDALSWGTRCGWPATTSTGSRLIRPRETRRRRRAISRTENQASQSTAARSWAAAAGGGRRIRSAAQRGPVWLPSSCSPFRQVLEDGLEAVVQGHDLVDHQSVVQQPAGQGAVERHGVVGAAPPRGLPGRPARRPRVRARSGSRPARAASDETRATVVGCSGILSRISVTAPSASTLPRSIRMISLVIDSTSGRMWLDTSTVRPAVPSSRTRSIDCLRETGSMPLSGSSRKITSGSWAMAWASFIFWRMPLE